MSQPFSLKYNASRTCANFLTSRAPRKILAGPVGGGKTSACIIHAITNAMQQEPDDDGIRRTRHIFIRNTIAQLRQTTQKSLLDWLPERVFGRYLTTQKEYYLKFADVESEIIMLALEDETDLRRLLSLEATTIYINEGKEISQTVLEGIVGAKRVGRYPSRKSGPGATYPCIIMDTNMPNFGTYHQRIMDGEEGDWETFVQPGGRSPEAENLEFLPPDYYSTEGLTEEHIRVFIDCQYGTSKDGLPVFKDTFINDFHVAKEPLKAVQSSEHPLVIGLDAGLTPAAIIGQQTPSGRVNVLAECYTPKGETIGMERFLQSKLTPMLTSRFPGMNVVIIVDPAAMQRSQATEETVFEIIKKAGYKVFPAPTNKTDLRIGSAETFFGQQVGGKAVLQIDPSCTGLISALANGYSYAIKKDGEVEDKPAKLHPVSDLCFVAGTQVLTRERWVDIEDLQVGDTVAVPGGYDVITHTGSRIAEELVKVVLSDGTEIVCTPDHPFAIDSHCFIPAGELCSGLQLISPEDVWDFQKECGTPQSGALMSCVGYAEAILKSLSGRLTKAKVSRVLSSVKTLPNAGATGSLSTGCGLESQGKIVTTGTKEQTKLAGHSTSTSGKKIMGGSRRGFKYTIKTATRAITRLITSVSWSRLSIAGCTFLSGLRTVRWTLRLHLGKRRMLLNSGMLQKREESGTASTPRKSSIRVVSVGSMSGGQRVFNLTTDRTHVFYAGGVLVHNCDGFTYLTVYLAGPLRAVRKAVEKMKVVSLGGWT